MEKIHGIGKPYSAETAVKYEKIPKEKLISEMQQVACDVGVVQHDILLAGKTTMEEITRITGIKQTVMNSLMQNAEKVTLGTMIRALLPFGYTLAVVPKKKAPPGSEKIVQELLKSLDKSKMGMKVTTSD